MADGLSVEPLANAIRDVAAEGEVRYEDIEWSRGPSTPNEGVRKEIITESNLGWAQTFRYDFSPLPDSLGKLYTFEISYLGKNQEAEIYLSQINKDMLGMKVLFTSSDKAETYRNDFMKISYAKEDEYPNGNAFINGESVPGDLKFQTYYSTSPQGFLIDSLTDFSKRVTFDKPFVLTFIFLLSTLTFILFMRLFLKRYSSRS